MWREVKMVDVGVNFDKWETKGEGGVKFCSLELLPPDFEFETRIGYREWGGRPPPAVMMAVAAVVVMIQHKPHFDQRLQGEREEIQDYRLIKPFEESKKCEYSAHSVFPFPACSPRTQVNSSVKVKHIHFREQRQQ